MKGYGKYLEIMKRESEDNIKMGDKNGVKCTKLV
jgi:hypothetical protein